MPLIMSKNAIVTCPHGGQGQNIPSQYKICINHYPMMVDGDRGVISGCAFPPAGPPCTSYQLNSMKLNSAYIDGKNIMLVTDVVLSDTGFPLLINETHVVEDNTTPAPVAPGQSPTYPSFFLNLVKPVVIAVPPLTSLSKTALPPLFTLTLSMQSLFPLKWQLLKLYSLDFNDVEDFTGDSRISPRGGEWSSPSLTLILKLDASYLGSLGLGDHFFILSAVDQRGNAGYAKAKLTITS